MTDPRETLARIRKQADAATDGPWNHYSINPRITPEHAVYSMPLDADRLARSSEIAGPVAPRDAEFIAAARTDVPALVDALEKVLNLHVKAQPIPAAFGTQEGGDYCITCAEDWPCPTVRAITQALTTT